jgi:hypothetical protein
MSGFPKVAVASNPALQYNDLLGWTFDPIAAASNAVLVQGPAYICVGRIPLSTSITVTNILMSLTSLGLTLTHSYLGLWNSAGTVLGQSADQSTAWGSLGVVQNYTLPLVGGPIVCPPLAANDFLWAGIYIGTWGTAPRLQSAVGTALDIINTSSARCRFGKIALADTSTLTSFTPSNLGASAVNGAYWFGLS